MNKRAYLVLGPEGSGTKLVTRLFVEAGCQGEWSHKQKFDREGPAGELVVVRRSYPHNGSWPNLKTLAGQLLEYEVRAVVMIRTYRCTVASRTRRSGIGATGGTRVRPS